jgi:hypothetical protein
MESHLPDTIQRNNSTFLLQFILILVCVTTNTDVGPCDHEANIGPYDHEANIGPYVYLLFLDFREQILQQENAEEL